MEVATHRGGVEVIERCADEWRTLCDESTDDHPFYRPEWIAAHIRAFTPDAKILLLTVRSDGKLLFVLPMLREWSLFSGVPLRTLRAPVSGHSSRFDAVRHASSEGDAAVIAAWTHLHNSRGWDVLDFHDVPEGGTVSALVQAASESGVHTARVPMLPNPYVPIPSDPGELQKLPVNKKLRSQLRGIREDLAAIGTLRLKRICTADRVALDRFYELESAGWKGVQGSAIKGNPKIRQFYDEVCQSAERFGYLSLYSLELNGEVLASHFGLSRSGRYFSPKIAYNEKFRKYAPGHLIVSEILKDCAARGISEYDIIGVDDDWKMKWTSVTRAMSMYFVFRRGLAGSLAHALRFRARPAIKKMIRR